MVVLRVVLGGPEVVPGHVVAAASPPPSTASAPRPIAADREASIARSVWPDVLHVPRGAGAPCIPSPVEAPPILRSSRGLPSVTGVLLVPVLRLPRVVVFPPAAHSSTQEEQKDNELAPTPPPGGHHDAPLLTPLRPRRGPRA